MLKRNTFFNQELAELHVHVGGAMDPAVMWSIAHDQGIRLPTKNFWEFVDMFTVTGEHIDWNDFHNLFHWTELIQSSTEAMERCTHEMIGGAYRNCNITTLEISFNPMFRCREGERDMDHIIMSAIHGMDRAMLEYPQTKVGLIFLIDRRLAPDKNEIIVQKAIRYKNRGVVGIDLAGPEPKDREFHLKDVRNCFSVAKKNGLGTCVHAGEHKGEEDVIEAVEYLSPDRIIHGINSYKNKDLLLQIKSKDILICLCPTVNLKTGFINGLNQLRDIINSFRQSEIKFCINTDNPEFFQTNLIKEYRLLLDNDIMSKDELIKANQVAKERSFIK